MRRIVVTGMGLVSPLGCGNELAWSRLLSSDAPTLNLDNGDTAAQGVDIVAREARRMPMEHAISNGFGFGAVNASVIFRRWQ